MSKQEHLIYGTRALIEAIKSGKEIERILIQQGLSNPLVSELKTLIQQHQLVYQSVPLIKLNRIVRGNHQGVVGYLSLIEYHKTENIILSIYENGQTPLVLMIDRVTDVRNIGAIARTAACAGVHAIIIPEHGSAQLNADAIKSSAGALLRIPVCREKNLKLIIEYLKSSGLKMFAASEKAKISYHQANFKIPCCIIMGSEENGVSAEYLKRTDEIIKIPMINAVESLNVSVAAGIILFEAFRQRSE
jgi:23S rRNA (guanosine2251-2'-O)-methyltransferase